MMRPPAPRPGGGVTGTAHPLGTPPSTPITPAKEISPGTTSQQQQHPGAISTGGTMRQQPPPQQLHQRPHHRHHAFQRPPPARAARPSPHARGPSPGGGGFGTTTTASTTTQQLHLNSPSGSSSASYSPRQSYASPRSRSQSPLGSRFKLPPPRAASPLAVPPPMLPSMTSNSPTTISIQPTATTATTTSSLTPAISPFVPSLAPKKTTSGGGGDEPSSEANAGAAAAAAAAVPSSGTSPAVQLPDTANLPPPQQQQQQQQQQLSPSIADSSKNISIDSSFPQESSQQGPNENEVVIGVEEKEGGVVGGKPTEKDQDQQEQQQQQPLSSDWQEVIDPNSGKPYYYNQITQETSWERPVAATAAPPTAPDQEGEVQPKESTATRSPEEETKTAGAASLDSPVDNATEGHEKDKSEEALTKTINTEAAEVVEDIAPSTTDSSSPEETPALPEGWQEVEDPTSGRTYYYNTADGTTSWERPTAVESPTLATTAPPSEKVDHAAVIEDELQVGGESGGDTLLQNQAAEDQQGPPATEEDTSAESSSTEEETSTDSSSTEEQIPGLLPEGWQEMVDQSSGRPYYYNMVDGSTSWDRPSLSKEEGFSGEKGEEKEMEGLVEGGVEPPNAQQQEALSAVEDYGEGKADAVEESITAPAEALDEPEVVSDSNVKDASAEISPLPEGWEEVADPTSGQSYYYNTMDGTTSWERPVSEKAPDNIADTEDESGGKDREETPANLEQPVEEEEAEAIIPTKEENVTAPIETDDGNDVNGPSALKTRLPEGWEEVADPTSGQVYYYNTTDGTTSWERPVSQEVPTDNTAASREEAEPNNHKLAAVEQEKEEAPKEAEHPLDEDGSSPMKGGGFDGGSQLDDVPANENAKPLPEGWEEVLDTDSGGTYYYNSIEGSTSWERPTQDDLKEDVDTPNIAEREAGATLGGDALREVSGEGEEKSDLNGDKPETAESFGAPENDLHGELPLEEAASSSALSEGWEEVVDPNTGATYYYNSVDGSTTWDRPVATDSKGGAPLPESAEVVEATATSGPPTEAPEATELEEPGESSVMAVSQGDNEVDIVSENATITTSEGTVGSAPDAALDAEPTKDSPLQSNEGDVGSKLPAGWEELVDPGSGDTYYYNAIENTTSWEKPEGADVGDGPGMETEPDEHVVDNRADIPSGETAGEAEGVDEPSDLPYNEDAFEANQSLPAGWEELKDPSSGNTYYYNVSEDISSWERPEATEDVAANVTSEPETSAPPKDVAGESPEDTAAINDDAMASSTNDSGDIKSAAPAEAPELEVEGEGSQVIDESPPNEDGLPPGWVELVDEGSGQLYYFCEADNTSSWEKPQQVSSSADLSEPTQGEVPVEPKKVTDTTDEPESAPEDTGTAPTTACTLPEGWAELIDEASGQPYYQSEDGATSWERPEPEGMLDSNEIQGILGEGEDQNEMDAETSELLPEWTEAVDPQSGQTYYVNAVDGSTSWERPSTSAEITDKSNDEAADDKEPVEAGRNSPLPQGWAEVIDPGSGKVYYFNETLNETTWDRPSVEGTAPPGESDLSDVKAPQVDELPEDWEEVFDPSSGQKYYYNHKTNETAWDRPGPVIQSSLQTEAKETQQQSQRMRPAHAIATFGFGGRLCTWRNTGNSSKIVTVHRTFTVVPTDPLIRIEQAKQESGFCGPLNGAKDDEVAAYLENRSSSNEKLLWNLVLIASKTNGMLRSDSHVCDTSSPEHAVMSLLLKDSEALICKDPTLDNPFTGDGGSLDAVEELVIKGKTEEAAKEAFLRGHLGVSLILASMCGQNIYQQAVANFADKTLRPGEPLYTISMLFSRQVKPESKRGFWGSDSDELRRNWKSHLAAIINTRIRGWDLYGIALGDELKRIGEIEAAHFCYLFCGCKFDSLATKGARLTLLGCSLSAPDLTLMTEESIAAFELTEAYEWAKRRGNVNAALKPLQPLKLMYAMLLADYGFDQAAKSYVSNIASCLGGKNGNSEDGIHGPLSLAAISCDVKSVLAILDDFERRLSSGYGAPEVSIASAPTMMTHPKPDTKDPVQGPAESAVQVEQLGSSGFQTGTDDRLTVDAYQQQEFSSQQVPHSVATPQIPLPATATPPLATMPPTKQPPLGSIVEGKIATPSSTELPPSAPSAPSLPPTGLPPMSPVTPVAQQKAENRQEELLPSSPMVPTPTPEFQHRPAPESTPAPVVTSPPQEAAAPTTQAKPKSAPTSAPANLNQGSKHSTPSSSAKKRGMFNFGFRDKVTKWLNPDATTVDLDDSEDMKAYYDEKRKVWVFPGEDPDEKAKPIGPPPTLPSTPQTPAAPSPTAAASAPNDPLAAMMAPPKRAPSSFNTKAKSVGATPSSVASGPPMMMPGMMPPGSSSSSGAGATPSPQFAVFMPKPADQATTDTNES